MALIVGLSGPPVAAGETWNGESRTPKAASTPTARKPRTSGGEHLTEVTAPLALPLGSGMLLSLAPLALPLDFAPLVLPLGSVMLLAVMLLSCAPLHSLVHAVSRCVALLCPSLRHVVEYNCNCDCCSGSGSGLRLTCINATQLTTASSSRAPSVHRLYSLPSNLWLWQPPPGWGAVAGRGWMMKTDRSDETESLVQHHYHHCPTTAPTATAPLPPLHLPPLHHHCTCKTTADAAPLHHHTTTTTAAPHLDLLPQLLGLLHQTTATLCVCSNSSDTAGPLAIGEFFRVLLALLSTALRGSRRRRMLWHGLTRRL